MGLGRHPKPANAAPGAETLTWAVGCTPAAGMANVLSAEKRQQVIALGWLGWSLRRIEEATGIRRERGAEERLLNLARNSSEPAIVRATALDVLRRYGPASLPVSVEGTRDPDPAVRTAAVASLERVPPDERVSLVAPLLGDPVRAVRIEAARVLSSVPSQSARCLAAPGGRAGRRGVHRRAERRPRPAGSTPEPGGAVREPGQARARGGTLPDRPSARPGLHSGAVEPRSSAE